MPDIHDDNGDPGRDRLLGHVIVQPDDIVQEVSKQADIGQGKDVPHRSDHIPWDQHGQGHGDQTDRHPHPLTGHRQGDDDAQRDFDDQDQEGEQELAAKGGVEPFRAQDLFEPVKALPEEHVVAEGFLYRVIDDGHDRDQRVKGHKRQHRQHEEPCALVFGFHEDASVVIQPSR